LDSREEGAVVSLDDGWSSAPRVVAASSMDEGEFSAQLLGLLL
jgi:hypothetical protein